MNFLKERFKSVTRSARQIWIRSQIPSVWRRLKCLVIKMLIRWYYQKNSDGSLTWKSRAHILVSGFVIGLFAAGYGREYFIQFLNLPKSYYLISEASFTLHSIAETTLALGLFGLFFGLSNWIIKNEDIQKQFRDTSDVRKDAFVEKNELIFSNAVKALFEQGDDKRSLRIYGFKEIVRLYNNQSITGKRTSYFVIGKHDLKGTLLGVTGPIPIKLVKINLSMVNFEEADFININAEQSTLAFTNFKKSSFNRVNLKSANLHGANLEKTVLNDVDLRGANMKDTKLQGAKYDDKTKFDKDFNPEERGMIKT